MAKRKYRSFNHKMLQEIIHNPKNPLLSDVVGEKLTANDKRLIRYRTRKAAREEYEKNIKEAKLND